MCFVRFSRRAIRAPGLTICVYFGFLLRCNVRCIKLLIIMHKVSENVTWKNLGSSVVLLNLTDSNYYVLNETASLAFRGVLDGKSTEEIAANFSGEYDCSPEEAMADVVGIMQYLTEEKLLKAAES